MILDATPEGIDFDQYLNHDLETGGKSKIT